MKAICTILAVTVAITLPVSARAENETFVHFIDITCAKYVEEGEAHSDMGFAYNWFVGGFLTGTNLVRGRNTPTDASTYRVWLKTYCQTHPFEPFVQALHALDATLGEGTRRLVAQPKSLS